MSVTVGNIAMYLNCDSGRKCVAFQIFNKPATVAQIRRIAERQDWLCASSNRKSAKDLCPACRKAADAARKEARHG